MKDLTDRQREILKYILNFSRDNDYQPSIREVAEEFGITSGAVFSHYTALEKKGYIQKVGARAIKFLRKESYNV